MKSYLNKNITGVKRSGQELKGLIEKVWNQMSCQVFLLLIDLKVLIMITSLQSFVVSGI